MPKLLDCTLRDGSYAVDFQFTTTDTENIVQELDDAGFPYIEIIEHNIYLKTAVLCEPQLGRRGLYPSLSTKESGEQVRAMMNLISYCDGSRTLLEIANLIEEPF